MTRHEAIAFGLAVLLIASVEILHIARTRIGALMIAGALLAITLMVFHRWSR